MDTSISSSMPWSRRMFSVLLFLILPASLPAQVNTNVVFDPANGAAIVAHSAALDLAPRMTLEAWVRPSPAVFSYGAVLSKSDPTGFMFGVTLPPAMTDSVRVGYACGGFWLSGPAIRSDGVTWTHIALAIDSVAGEAVFYVNGVANGTVTGSTVKIRNNSADMYIGSSQSGDLFHGALNEIRIWNTVRSAVEIGALWNNEAKGNEPGLVAVYHFADERDTVAWNRAASGGLAGTLGAGLHFLSVPWAFAFTDEQEPNNCCAGATVVNYGGAILNAAIAPGDTDVYKLWTWPGDVIRVASAAKNPGDPGDLSISVFGCDSVTHITTYITNYPAFYTALSVPGYHYIRVLNRSASVCTYTLTSGLTNWRIAADTFEPNNSQAEATQRPWGTVIEATLFPGLDAGVTVPDTDYYAFTGVAGEIGFFIYSLQGYSCGSGFLNVIGPSGVLPKSFPNAYQNVKFPTTGTYYARIRPNEATYDYLVAGFKGLEDIHGMLYDVGTYGDAVQLCDGMNNAYDYAYRLKIGNKYFTAEPDYSLSEVDGRQFVFGPATYSGLSVTRKFFVPSAASGDTLGFMRIQEILTNPTGAPITVNVGVWSDLGARPARPIATSTGDTLLALGDTWLWTDDGYPTSGSPSLLHIFDGAGGSDSVDSIRLDMDKLYWEWRNVTVQPGETKIYLYFVSQDSLESTTDKKTAPFSQPILPPVARLGLGADAGGVANWPTSAVVSVNDQPHAPLAFALEQNYPNPFNPSTTIRYAIPGASGWGLGASLVRLVVYDVLGREVAVLVNGSKAPGKYEVTFSAKGGSASGGNAAGLASGVYLYRLTAGNFVQTRKMLLIK